MRAGSTSRSQSAAGNAKPCSSPSTARKRFAALAALAAEALPVEQEALVVGERRGLDLVAQALQRVAMDAREQPPLAPLLAAAPIRVKLPRIAVPCCSSAASAGSTSSRREAERPRQRVGRHGAERLEAAAHELAQRRVAVLDGAAEHDEPLGGDGARERDVDLGQPLRGDPHRAGAAAARRPSHGRRRASARTAAPTRRLRRPSTKPSSTSASCSSSAFSGCGQASSRTRAIASGSSLPSSAACSGVM